MRPAVSICVPAYEQPEFLERCLESIFSQDFQDFEVIVTDDSASDDVQKVVEKWSPNGRIIYQKNMIRLGSPANWNAAMALARSDLIKFLHHDDWFATNNSLSRFVEAMNTSPDVKFAFSAANACEDDGSRIFLHQPTQSQFEHFVHDPLSLQFANFIGAPSATIFRKLTDFEFDPRLRWVVDIDAYLRIMGSSPRCAYIPDPLISIASNGAHQVTRDFAADRIARVEEHFYLYAKHPPKKMKARLQGISFLKNQLSGYSYAELRQLASRRAPYKQTIEESLALNIMKIKTGIRSVASRLRDRMRRKVSQESTSRVSYSQCGEDMICDFLFSWLGVKHISYLDIGAHHPKWLSNTYYFYDRGYRGVLIEPDEDLCVGLRRERPGDTILNLAVAASGENEVNMYVMTSRTLNTLDRTQADELVAGGREKIEDIRSVRLSGINAILKDQFGTSKPNLVSLDIEGLDYEILSAWDFALFRPEVFCVETLTYTEDNSERKLVEIIDLMNSKGYRVYADTYVNTIFVCETAWARRLRAS
jgi:FkbM family methyltransferase